MIPERSLLLGDNDPPMRKPSDEELVLRSKLGYTTFKSNWPEPTEEQREAMKRTKAEAERRFWFGEEADALPVVPDGYDTLMRDVYGPEVKR